MSEPAPLLLSPEAIASLTEKARACPKGPDDGPWEVLACERKWQTGERGVQFRVVCDTKTGWEHPLPLLEVDPDGYCAEDSTRPFADYIAAVSPDVVLALLARLQSSEEERDRLRERAERAEAVKKAWVRSGADFSHYYTCPAGAGSFPEPLDPRCTCGLRELVLALEAL